MFANDTHQQFTSHTFSLQCYSTSTSIGILYFRSTVSLSSPSILIVYMISVLIVPTFHCQVIQYCWALPSTFSSFYFYLLLSHISCFYAPDRLSSIICMCLLRWVLRVVTSYTISYDDLWHTCFGCNAAIAYLYEWGILFHSIWYPHLPETNHNISMIESTIMMYDRQFLFTSPNKIVLC